MNASSLPRCHSPASRWNDDQLANRAILKGKKMSKRRLRLAAALATLVMLALPTAAAKASPIGAGLWSTTAAGGTGSDNCGMFTSDSNGFCIVPSGAGEPSVELGVKFTSSKAVNIVGVRVYRVDGGAVTGALWGADGTRVAGPASFSGSSTNIWQDAPFSAPVAITPGQTYVASYQAPTPSYAFEHYFFTNSAYTVGPITAHRFADERREWRLRLLLAGAAFLPKDVRGQQLLGHAALGVQLHRLLPAGGQQADPEHREGGQRRSGEVQPRR